MSGTGGPGGVLGVSPISGDPALAEAVRAALAQPPYAGATPIGLVGCGWIGGLQLQAYARAGFRVVAVADHDLERAEAARDRWAPDAVVHPSAEELLGHPGLAVVDVATHLEGRPETIAAALRAGKHVLSQKPFVESEAVGRELAALAAQQGRILAVNQNGRWAPHFAPMLALVRAGLIGEVASADFAVDWPHDEMVGDKPAFTSMTDLVLFDFGAHWFDLVGVLAAGRGPLRVVANADRRPGQRIVAPLQADALVWAGGDDGFRANLRFRAGERLAETGQYRVSGSAGVVEHRGRSLGGHEVALTTAAGEVRIAIDDDWFAHGLAGAMRALLDAVETGGEPPNTADSALEGLAIAFAALESARSGRVVAAGEARSRGGDDG